MKETLVRPGPATRIISTSIPAPSPNEVLIKVAVSGSNPIEWKVPEWFDNEKNTGVDMAGTVVSVGDHVLGFRAEDRVAAFNVIWHPHGSFAEYAIAPAHSTIHLPGHVSFEEAATVPTAAATAAVGLFVRLELPLPWNAGRQDGKLGDQQDKERKTLPFKAPEPTPVDSKWKPLLVYGAATAVGAYAIQIAKHANVGPIIAVAGKGIPYVKTLIDSAVDTVVDYRQDDEKIVSAIRVALKGQPLQHCYDAISAHGSYMNACELLKETLGARITTTNPELDIKILDRIQHEQARVIDIFDIQTDFSEMWSAMASRGLRDRWLRPHPQVVKPNGLDGVEQGLKDLKDGKNSASKYVFRIDDTPCLRGEQGREPSAQ